MKPVDNILRKQGLISTRYLDDIFCIGSTYESCVKNVTITKRVLESLGFLINKEKSMNFPATQCKFLGFIINSSQMTLELTQEKRKKVVSLIEIFLHKKSCKIRNFASLIGLLIAACPADPYGLSWVYIGPVQ